MIAIFDFLNPVRNRIILIGAFLLFPNHILAKEKYAPWTLYDYITINCKVGCVDQDRLLKNVDLAVREHQLDRKLLLAVIRVESAFQIKAQNRSNVGLTQVNLYYHRPKFKGPYYDIGENVRVGSIILRDCLKKHKQNTTKALVCYNGNGDSRYVEKVNKAYREIGKLILG